MKRYDSYKDSGVEWIGEVPSHWEIMKIRRFLDSGKDGIKIGPFGSSLTGKVGSSELPCKVYGQWNIVNGDFTAGTSYVSDETFNDLQAYKIIPNDVLISMMGTVGKCAVIPEGVQKGIMDSHVVKVRFDESKIDSRFFYYFYDKDNSAIIYSNIQKVKKGSIMDGLNSSIIKDLMFCLPPLPEQTAIATYLDNKCSKIDNVIATQEKRVELLRELKQSIITRAVTRGINPDAKMKDSGVEWIGEIPEHWEVMKLKHISELYGRIGFRGYNQTDLVPKGEGAITLSPSNMKGEMNYDSCSYLSWYKYHESPEIIIYNGDVLFVKTGSTYGKSALVENLPMEATINPQIVVFKNFKCNNKFFQYALLTPGIRYQIDNTVIGSTIPTISQEKINNYIVALPPIQEQDEIVQFIQKRIMRVSSSITKALRQIELLKEYKQSLITEVVTGKRKVC